MQRIPQVWPGWQADELIGQGAYGKVYRSSRTVGGHVSQAAIKVIEIPRDESEVSSLRRMGMDAMSIRSYFEETAQSVVREVAFMDSLKGAPNVVAVEDYQLVEHEGGVGWTILIRMELLEDLPSYQDRMGMPSPREAAKIGVDVCRALSFCHSVDVIHRDIKPENVFVSRFGEYKLGDFGLARRLDEGSRSTKSVAGTDAFMAPEVSTGHYDKTVDIYSLGVMLYRWLNGGKPPFVGARDMPGRAKLEDAQFRRLSGERPPLPAGEGVDPVLAAIVRKAVEPRPADRWGGAEEFGAALQAWADGKAVDLEESANFDQVPDGLAIPDEAPSGGYDPLDALEEVHGAPAGATPSADEVADGTTDVPSPDADDPLRQALASVAELWHAYVRSVDWEADDLYEEVWEADMDAFDAVFVAVGELKKAVGDGASDKRCDRALAEECRGVLASFDRFKDHASIGTPAKEIVRNASELSGILGIEFPPTAPQADVDHSVDVSMSMADYARAVCADFLSRVDARVRTTFGDSAKLRYRLGIGGDEAVLLMHDNSTAIEGRSGFAITDGGLFFRDTVVFSPVVHYSWREFAMLDEPVLGGYLNYYVQASTKDVASYFEASLSIDNNAVVKELLGLYRDLHRYVRLLRSAGKLA